tara:strand:+ start:293 stop:478 length:186 start_codon:yes stop_codon:yes gene_type:complete
MFNKYLMDINNNLKLLNSIISHKKFSIKDRLLIFEIAKVSKDSNELIENLKWELNLNLKYL